VEVNGEWRLDTEWPSPVCSQAALRPKPSDFLIWPGSSVTPTPISEINAVIREPIESEYSKIFDVKLKNVIDKYGLMLDLSLDFMWNAPRKGKMGTLTVISSRTHKVLYRVHRLRTGKKKNHEESNKAMEGKAVEELVGLIKGSNLMVNSVCHDNDSGTKKIFETHFGAGKQNPPAKILAIS